MTDKNTYGTTNWERISFIVSLAILMLNLPSVYKICLKEIGGSEGYGLFYLVIGTIIILLILLGRDVYNKKLPLQQEKILKLRSLVVFVIGYIISLLTVMIFIGIAYPPSNIFETATISSCIFIITCIFWWFCVDMF